MLARERIKLDTALALHTQWCTTRGITLAFIYFGKRRVASYLTGQSVRIGFDKVSLLCFDACCEGAEKEDKAMEWKVAAWGLASPC